MLIPGYVLRVKANGVTYQFGLNWGRFWQGELPFPMRHERGHVGHIAFSMVVRIVLLAAIVYWLW